MQVELNLEKRICIVTKESNDPVCSGIVNAKGESRLLYLIKKELIKQGFDVIKKRMYKDGHLVDDLQQYVRTRSSKKGFMIYNNSWACYGAEEPFNKDGRVVLAVEVY
jgi:hypothetical protein